jgi:hypothetical protein
MRMVDCAIWKHKAAIATRVLYFIVSGIQPAAVKCPVSASLVGSSSHLKLFVRSIARSILCCCHLRKINQTIIQRNGSVEKCPKNRTKISYFDLKMKFFANKLLKNVH